VGTVKRLKPKAPSRTAQKSHYRPEYRAIFETLRETRIEAGLTQIDLAGKLGRSQNFVSQAELGYKRLDGLQLWDWMRACGSDMQQFGQAVEAGVQAAKQSAGEAGSAKSAKATKTAGSKTTPRTTKPVPVASKAKKRASVIKRQRRHQGER
jgi:transcriptional regulator with XRE-family HTH domain